VSSSSITHHASRTRLSMSCRTVSTSGCRDTHAGMLTLALGGWLVWQFGLLQNTLESAQEFARKRASAPQNSKSHPGASPAVLPVHMRPLLVNRQPSVTTSRKTLHTRGLVLSAESSPHYPTPAQVKFSTPSKPRPATIQAPIPMSTMNLVKVGTA
jgi:hypothetical protein